MLGWSGAGTLSVVGCCTITVGSTVGAEGVATGAGAGPSASVEATAGSATTSSAGLLTASARLTFGVRRFVATMWGTVTLDRAISTPDTKRVRW